MATIHISLAEAERDFHGLVKQLDENTTFLIESESRPVAVLQAAPPRPLTFKERIALLRKHETAVQDDTFADDVAAAIERHREPLDSTIWD